MAIDREKYLDAGEVRRLRTVTEARAITDLAHGRITGPLAWMVVDAALSTGLRVSELADIHHGDLDLRRGSLRARRLKRRQRTTETIALPAGLVEHLRAFIEWKGQVDQPTGKTDALFMGKRGPLTARGLQQIWTRAVRDAGLPEGLSIHCARHTLAVHLLRATGNLRMAQKQLGHASPATTANLYADVPFEDMQAGLTGLYQDEVDDR